MDARTGRLGRRAGFAVLFLLVFLAYSPVLRSGFIWDDDRHVTRPDLQPVSGLARIWFELGATQQYYPVLHSAFWVEHRIWGGAPLGYHLLNVFLHAASACLFVLVLEKLGLGKKAAFLGGLLFALHPVCVESVAWVSEQKNTLSTFFYLLAGLTYLRYAGIGVEAASPPLSTPVKRRGRRFHYLLATALFVLALLSKTVTATLPAALLVAIAWKRGWLGPKADDRPLLKRIVSDAWPLAPWFVLGLAGGLCTALVERKFIGAEGTDFHLSLVGRCLLAGRVLWFYLGKLLLPANLVFVYPRWAVDARLWPQYLCLAAAIVAFAGLWIWRRRAGGVAAAFLFFGGSLVPALGFVNVYPFRYSYVADHFQYLACLGPIALVAAAVEAARTPLPRWAIASFLVLVLGALTWSQAKTYRNAEVLYRTTLARNPGCWMAEVNLGKVLRESGRTAEAIPHYERGVRLKPDATSYYDLGDAMMETGRPEEAKADYEAALRLRPDFPQARTNLALALFRLGRTDEAAAEDRAALRLQPNSAEAHNNLGNIYLNQRRLDEAEAEFSRAIRIRPSYGKPHDGLGGVYFRRGQMAEAARQFETAFRLDPSLAEAHLNLGVALSRMGRVPEAIAQCEEALRINPNFAVARSVLNRFTAWQAAHSAAGP